MKRVIFLCWFVLSGCNESTVVKGDISLPALPVVQQSVISLSPLFEGIRHDGLIDMLCALARGEKSESDVADYLKQNNIMATADNDYALFIGPKRPEQVVACAAYVATTVLIPPNPAEFLQPTDKEPSEDVNKQHSEDADKQHEKEGIKDPADNFQINQQFLTESLSRKLAIAQANTDIFALIIQQLPPHLTLEEYHQEICRLFSLLASSYLERINMYYQPDVMFNLLQMQDTHFAFTSSTGFLFEFGLQGLRLQLDGINWYGQGQLMGKNYALSVSHFPPEVTNLLK